MKRNKYIKRGAIVLLLALVGAVIGIPETIAASSATLIQGPTATASTEAFNLGMTTFSADKVVKYNDRTDAQGEFQYDDDEYNCFKSKNPLASGAYDITLDYGVSHIINQVNVAHANVDPLFTTYNTVDFQIQVSNDNVAWTTVDTCTNNSATITKHNFSSRVARYVRLHITKTHNSGTAIIYDIRAFERKTSLVSLAAPAAKTYNLGETMSFTLTSDYPLTVTGAPVIKFDLGSKKVNATYLSGSGTSNLTFNYVIQKGDVDTDGVTTESTITLLGGSIKDVSGVNMNLTLPALTGGNLVKVDAPLTYGEVAFEKNSEEALENITTASIKLVRANGSDGTITVNYSLNGGSATAGTDFNLANGSVVFAEGETSKTITLPIVNDSDIESDETVIIQLSLNGGSNGAIGANSQFTYTIKNNDYLPLQLDNTQLLDGMHLQPYSATLVPSGGKSPYTFAISSGNLPVGMSLSATGQLSGVPTTSGMANFEVTLKDSNVPATELKKNYSILVKPAPHYIGAVAVATSTPIAGESILVTLTAKDSAGNIDMAFTGPHNVVMKGYDIVATMPMMSVNAGKLGLLDLDVSGTHTLSLNFTNGVATVDLSLFKVTQQQLEFKIDDLTQITPAIVTVTPKHAAAASFYKFSNDLIAPPVKYGQIFTKQPQVMLFDQYGNRCANDSTTQVTATSTDSSWTLKGSVQQVSNNGIVVFADLYAENIASITDAQIKLSATGVTDLLSEKINLPEKPSVTSIQVVTPFSGMVNEKTPYVLSPYSVNLQFTDGSTRQCNESELSLYNLEWQWSTGEKFVVGSMVALSDHNRQLVLKDTVGNVSSAPITINVTPNSLKEIRLVNGLPPLHQLNYEVGDVINTSNISINLVYANNDEEIVTYPNFTSKGIVLKYFRNSNMSEAINLSTPLTLADQGGVLMVESISGGIMSCPMGAINVLPLLNVDFLNSDNSILETVQVKRGGTAVATKTPVAPEGFIFNGWETSLINITTDAQIKPKFIEKPPLVLDSITVNTQPKLSYVEDEILDLTQLNVTIGYTDNSTKSLGIDEFPVNGLVMNITSGSALTLSNNGAELNISYNGLVKAVVGMLSIEPNNTTCMNRATADSQALILTFSNGDNSEQVKGNIQTPTIGSVNGSSVSWSSSQVAVISNEGVVTRPQASVGNVAVNLKATINYKGVIVEKRFDVTVVALDAVPPTPPTPPIPPTPPTPPAPTPTPTPTEKDSDNDYREPVSNGSTGGSTSTAPVPTPQAPISTPAATSDTLPIVVPAPVVAPTQPVVAPQTPAPVKSPILKAEAFIAKVDKKGIASAKISLVDLADELALAKQTKNKELVIEIEAPKNTNRVNAIITQDVLKAIKTNGIQVLTVETAIGEVNFDKVALGILQSKTKKDVTISVEKQSAKSKNVYKIEVLEGTKRINAQGNGISMTVTIPYTLAKGESLKAIKVYVVDVKGSAVLVKNTIYNAKTKAVTFTVK